jgi:hypothetical protein
MRYQFEEELEEDENGNVAKGQVPQRYKGYIDDNYAASTQPNSTVSNASYAIMIYDVTFRKDLTSSLGQEKRVQACSCREALQIRERYLDSYLTHLDLEIIPLKA